MMDFMFFVKTFCLTVLIVVLMQIRVGTSTIEVHTMNAIQSSFITAPLNMVAQGGAKLIRDFTQSISSRVKGNGKKKHGEDAHATSSSSEDVGED